MVREGANDHYGPREIWDVRAFAREEGRGEGLWIHLSRGTQK